MKTNIASPSLHTHEGAPAIKVSPEQELERTVLATLLWENTFYADGQCAADRIEQLCQQVAPEVIAGFAVKARHHYHLRHIPLFLLVQLARKRALTAGTVNAVVTRADEMGELLALYWKLTPHVRGKRAPVPAAMKKGLALAIQKFSAYQLAKHNSNKAAVSIKDVIRITHPAAQSEQQAVIWKKIIDGTLESPDTWEVQLSAGANKKETFERLLREGKLGYMALLRNLRNMAFAGVDYQLVNDAIIARKDGAEQVLPFRYIAALRAAPMFCNALDVAMQAAVGEMAAFSGGTNILVDVSGSMNDKLSAKSDMTCMDASCALAAIWPGAKRTFTFSDQLVEVPAYKGLALVNALRDSQYHSSTFLGAAVAKLPNYGAERFVVITDEQSADAIHRPLGYKNCYMINVGNYKNGVGYGDWIRINGFSEAVLQWMKLLEDSNLV